MIAPIALLLAAAHGTCPTGSPSEVELPPGRVATLYGTLARLDPPAVRLPVRWPAWDDHSQETGWGDERPWRRWVELLRAEGRDAARAESAPDVSRRVSLALLAATQGRSAESWGHLLAAGTHPMVHAALPALVPGVPQSLLGSDEPLPAGVLLTPALPPPHDEALASGQVDRLAALAGRTMRITEVRVEGTRFELRVIVEGDGVQVDLLHLDGPPVPVRVLLPVPGGVELGRIYTNWEKIGEGRFPLTVEVGAEPRRQTLWGRFRPRVERWPAPAPTTDLAQTRPGAEILLVVPAERLGEPRLLRLAEALAELFERPTRLSTRGAALRPALYEPTAIHLEEEPMERKLLGILRMVEAHALAGAAGR